MTRDKLLELAMEAKNISDIKTGEFAATLTFSSCRAAGAFSRAIEQAKQDAALLQAQQAQEPVAWRVTTIAPAGSKPLVFHEPNEEQARFIHECFEGSTIEPLYILSRQPTEAQPSQPEASTARYADDPDDDAAFRKWREDHNIDLGDKWVAWAAWCGALDRAALVSQQTAQQPAQAPRNASEVMDFIGANFNIREADPENPSDADVYQVTAHDLLSSFREWFDDWDAAPSTQQGGGQ